MTLKWKEIVYYFLSLFFGCSRSLWQRLPPRQPHDSFHTKPCPPGNLSGQTGSAAAVWFIQGESGITTRFRPAVLLNKSVLCLLNSEEGEAWKRPLCCSCRQPECQMFWSQTRTVTPLRGSCGCNWPLTGPDPTRRSSCVSWEPSCRLLFLQRLSETAYLMSFYSRGYVAVKQRQTLLLSAQRSASRLAAS